MRSSAGEVPLEWLGDLVVVVLEVVERLGDFSGALEVVGFEHLALDDRVVDLDLVEPAGVYGGCTRVRLASVPASRLIDVLPR